MKQTVARKYLSDEQIFQYHRDGFLLIQQLYSPEEVEKISSWIDELSQQTPEVGKQMVYWEDSLRDKGKKVLSRIENFVQYHEGMASILLKEKLLQRVAELIGEKPQLFKEKINFKMPGGGGFTPHQDIQAGWRTYAQDFISVLITIDPSTRENGCLELAAGHHKKGLLGKEWEPLTAEDLKEVEFVSYPTSPGDVVFFDGYTPHQSAANLTTMPRRNLYISFNPASQGEHRQEYFADKRASFPPDNEREQGKEYRFKV